MKNIITNNKKKSEVFYFKKNFPLTFLALPGIIILFIFNYIPLYGLVLPFKNYKASLGFFKSSWTGFENFKYLFTSNDILNATKNTISYNIVFIVLGTFLAVMVALMLFELSGKAVKGYQTILFLPYFISWVVVAYILKAFLDSDYGLFNNILKTFNQAPIEWYSEPKYWPTILIITNMWKNVGYNTVIYYASLMSIDKTYYEAAKIDGAGKFRQTMAISVPLLIPMITILTIMNIGKIFYSDFGLFYNVPLDSSMLYSTTDVIDTYVYRSLVDLGDIGMSSAAGFYQSVVGFILVLFTNWCVKKFNSENSLF